MSVKVRGEVVRLSKAAVLMKIENEGEIWIPYSVIGVEDLAPLDVGATQTISVEDWFAKKEKLA